MFSEKLPQRRHARTRVGAQAQVTEL